MKWFDLLYPIVALRYAFTRRNNMRRANTYNPDIKFLYKEITSDIHKHNLWKEHLDAQHALSLEDYTRYIQQSTSTHI